MKRFALMLAIILYAVPSHAAKAAAVVTSTQSNPNSVMVQVQVSEDSGAVSFSTSFSINFTSSPNQLNTDIKQRVRDELVRLGIVITVNDIFLFGGAQ